MPRWCGAIGDYDTATVARVAARLDAPAREVHRDAESIMFADSSPSRWAEDRRWGLSFAEREPRRTAGNRAWEDAAAGGALGLWGDGSIRGIHTSNAGVAPVYWMRAPGAVYFASRIAALVRAGIGSVSVDWQAWASILALNGALDGTTPFAEVRRLGARTALRLRKGVPVIDDRGFPWVEGEPLPVDEAAERVVAALRSEVAALEPYGPITATLTGGWDSRLIACTLAERDLIAHAYTVGTDKGNDLEERLASRVATALGASHTVVQPEEFPFSSELERAADRVEYQSLPHLAMHRLERELPAGGIVSEGFAGFVLKGRCLGPEILESESPLDGTFDTLVARRAQAIYDDSAWTAIRRVARDAFLRENDRYTDFIAPPSPALYNRSLHANATSPTAIIGRRNRLFTPLTTDALATAAWGTPPPDRAAKRLYRRVFDLLRPEVGALPSTNDAPDPGMLSRPRLRKAEARAAHLALLARSPLRPWFSPRLRRLIARNGLAPIDGHERRLRLLQAICMFGLWCERYADLVGEVDPAELLGEPPGVVSGPRGAASRSSTG